VTLFGTSLFQSGSQQTAISVSNQHLWFDSSPTSAVGGFVVRNTGDRVVALDSISIRGVSVQFSDWYYALDTTGIGELGKNQTILSCVTPGCTITALIDKDNNGTGDTAAIQSQGPLTLQTGQTGIIYYKVPTGKITASDVGASTSVSVFAGSAGSVQTVTVAHVT